MPACPTDERTILEGLDELFRSEAAAKLIGVLAVDERARILWANGAVDAVLKASDGLAAPRGYLKCDHASDQLRMLEGIRSASLSPAAADQRLVIRRPSGWLGYQVLIRPLPPRASSLPLVALRIGDPAASFAKVSPVLAELYGLTPAECEVAMAIGNGLQIDQIAESRSVQPGTVRVLLGRVFDKVGARRQVDLARVVFTAAMLAAGGSKPSK